MLGRTRHIHFVGIGGAGMSGLAELLVNQGYVVTGSDLSRSAVTDRLVRTGVRFHEGHDAAHAAGADVVVVSSAVRPSNPEIRAAVALNVPVIPRAEMLAELMRLKHGIAVAGSHGKTSTTSMVAVALERAGLDPTAVIGGRLSAFGSNARLGSGEYMVAEADESDRSFLRLSPTIAVITNVDREHLDAYGDFARLLDAFIDFANRVPFYGAAILCADDRHLAGAAARVRRPVVTYGFDAAAEVRGHDIELSGFGARCRVDHRGTLLGEVALQVPGRHNLCNALAAVAVGLELEVPFAPLAAALADFRGVERRFQRLGTAGGVDVIDDYGHHPTEIAAVLEAARPTASRRIVLVFQPHRYTRTRDLIDDFADVLGRADVVVLTEIYAAGEDPLPGVTVLALADAVRRRSAAAVHVVPDLDDVPGAVAEIARPGDVVITLGAGSIGAAAAKVLQALGRAGAA